MVLFRDYFMLLIQDGLFDSLPSEHLVGEEGVLNNLLMFYLGNELIGSEVSMMHVVNNCSFMLLGSVPSVTALLNLQDRSTWAVNR
jgi:hypothetical protein